MQDGKNTYQTAEEVVETALSGQMLLEYPLSAHGVPLRVFATQPSKSNI